MLLHCFFFLLSNSLPSFCLLLFWDQKFSLLVPLSCHIFFYLFCVLWNKQRVESYCFHKKYFIGRLYQICHCFSNVTKVKIIVFWYQPIALCVEWIIVALCFFLVISPFILHFRLTFVLKWFLEDLALILRLLSCKLHEEIKAT